MVNALGFQRRCYRVIGHLRARLFADKTAFLDARSAQHAGWKGFAFSHETRNSCPTIGFDITRFSATTCIRWPGPLLDAWTGLLGASRRPGFRPNVVEHTMLAPSRKAVSGRAASRPACLAGRASSARCAGPRWGSYFAQRAFSVLRRQAEPKRGTGSEPGSAGGREKTPARARWFARSDPIHRVREPVRPHECGRYDTNPSSFE